MKSSYPYLIFSSEQIYSCPSRTFVIFTARLFCNCYGQYYNFLLGLFFVASARIFCYLLQYFHCHAFSGLLLRVMLVIFETVVCTHEVLSLFAFYELLTLDCIPSLPESLVNNSHSSKYFSSSAFAYLY